MINEFPTTVTLPGGARWQVARVAVLDGEVLVFGRDGKKPLLLFRAQVIGEPDVPDRSTAERRVVTADGVVAWTKRGGCGCGNPLKRLTSEAAIRKALA